MTVPRLYLFRRSNGIYYVRLENDGQRLWKSTRCTTKRDALQCITELKDLFRPKSPHRSLAQFAEEYRTYGEAHLAKGTLAGYLNTLRSFQASVGDLSLSMIMPRHADAYISNRAQHVKPATVNIELRSLRAVFSMARKWGYIEQNPFQDVRPLHLPEQAAIFLSRDDFERLMAVVEEGWLRELIVFSVATGMRRGEVLNLRWQDADLSRKLIAVRNQEGFRTKSHRDRAIPMSDAVHAMLAQRAPYAVCDYVFQRRGYQIGASFLSHRFKHYVREAELDARLHWHSLRHTFASWLAQDGVSLYALQKLLGHSSASVTQIYSHLQPDQMHETVNRIKVPMN